MILFARNCLVIRVFVEKFCFRFIPTPIPGLLAKVRQLLVDQCGGGTANVQFSHLKRDIVLGRGYV